MARLSVYYDFYEDAMKPIILLASFRLGELDWNKKTIYLPMIAPFKAHMMNEMNLTSAASILLEDLTKHPEHNDRFGILLPTVKERYEQIIDLSRIEQFVIRLTDIEEVLQCNANEFYGWK